MRTNLPVTSNELVLTDTTLIVSKTDLQGKLTYVNKDFLDISGFTEAELIGEPHNIVRHPDMPAEAFEDLWRALNAGTAPSTLSSHPSSKVMRHDELGKGCPLARCDANWSTDNTVNRSASTSIWRAKVSRLTTMPGCDPVRLRSSSFSTRGYIKTTARCRRVQCCHSCRRPSAYSTCATISPAVRFRCRPILAVAQNVQPIAQPAWLLMQTVLRRL